MKDFSPFFITGLPRSRTTWLANLLTHGRSFCFHDAIKYGVSAESLRRQFEIIKAEHSEIDFIGDSDSGLIAIAAEVISEFPGSKWVIINRDASVAEASYRRFFDGRDPYLPPGSDIHAAFKKASELLDETRRAIPASDLLEVDFDALNDIEKLSRIWEWCIGEGFNSGRAEMLNTFQVNPFPEKT